MAPVQESMRVLNYVTLSAITLMAYDWILSFSDEVKYIWRAAWSAPKVLYYISRYYPVCYLSILYYVRNLTSTSDKMYVHECSDYTWYHGFGGVICILPPVTAIFTLRICAIYRHSRMVIVFVWFLWFAETAGELITTFRVTIGEHTDKTTTYGPGCLTQTKADPHLYRSELLAWAPALTGSLTLFILTLYRLGYIFPQFLFPIKRKKLSFGDHNRLMMDFLTDGTIYFFFIFVATLLTMISDLLPKLTFFNDWWNPWFILLYSLSGSRLVINLRRNASIGSEIASTSAPEEQIGSMEFWTPSLRSVAGFNPDEYLHGELEMQFAPGKDV